MTKDEFLASLTEEQEERIKQLFSERNIFFNDFVEIMRQRQYRIYNGQIDNFSHRTWDLLKGIFEL